MDFFNLEWYKYILIIGAGIIAGFINTMAGSGSLLTLPLLIFLGLPPNVANGTNRIGVLLQTVVSSTGFKKQGSLDLKTGMFLAIPAILGSIPGAILALKLDNRLMTRAIGFLLVFMFFIILFKPEVWIKGRAGSNNRPYRFINIVIFFFIGLYGGFIQAGVGFFLLAGLVLGVGADLVKANALKNFLVLAFTVFALAIFIYKHQVSYEIGLIMAIGSMIGAWLGTWAAIKKGTVFVRYVLLVAILGSAIKLVFF